ncbi:MAG: hypothetical protein ACFNL9_03995 [Porphyromonas endodontalis]|jgi:hypothetical protein
MKHKEFILSPLFSLIEKTLFPMDLYKGQVCNYIMKEYVLQTLFLKLSGCMEQKAKCILWDIATHDFEFRRNFLNDLNPKQGEYSNFESKNLVYKSLIEQVEKIEDTKKQDLLNQLKEFKDNILGKSIAKEWLPRELQNLDIKNLFDIKRWGVDTLFNSPLNDKIYKSLYDHRNRCAHNALSFQGNVMSPTKIMKTGENNYASWFTLLVLMDLIYMELYKRFSSKSY